MQPIFADPNPDREPYTDFFSTLLEASSASNG